MSRIISRDNGRTTVFIVDDHPLVCDSLSRLIQEEPDLYVCGSANNADEALKAIQKANPDLIIVDIGLHGKSGLELIHSLAGHNPDRRILVVSMHDESVYSNRCFKAGARGYVNKRESSQKIILAIRCILSGGIFFSNAAIKAPLVKTLSLSQNVSVLSDRELEVFRQLAAGRETPEIARDLSLSIKTVQSYCSRIKEKLYLRNATELLQAATRWSDEQNAV